VAALNITSQHSLFYGPSYVNYAQEVLALVTKTKEYLHFLDWLLVILCRITNVISFMDRNNNGGRS